MEIAIRINEFPDLLSSDDRAEPDGLVCERCAQEGVTAISFFERRATAGLNGWQLVGDCSRKIEDYYIELPIIHRFGSDWFHKILSEKVWFDPRDFAEAMARLVRGQRNSRSTAR